MSTKPKDIDERARRTRNRIARAVVHLAKLQPLETVTVQQLVREAGISRSTFYAHFTGLADYLTRSYAWILERGAQISATHPGGAAQVLPVRAVLDHMAMNAAYVRATLHSPYRPAMMAAGEERLRCVASANLQRLRPDLCEIERQAMATFIAGGFMGMVRQWTASGLRETPHSLERRFETFCRRIVGSEPASA